MAVLGMDRLARRHGEGAAFDGEVDILLRRQMHLDPRAVVVPDRTVAEGVDRDGAVQLAVDPVEQVAVERRRHALRIVIGGDQHLAGLGPVHADQQHRAFAQRAPHRAQQVGRHGGRHVADGRAGEESQFGGIRHHRGQRQRAHEIALQRMDGQVGKCLLQPARGFAQEVARNVDRHIGRRFDTAQQDGRLGRGARAELDHRAPLADMRDQIGAHGLQDRRLGPCRVIFG